MSTAAIPATSRSVRPAGAFLSRMIRNRGVTADMAAEYGAEEKRE